MNLHDHWPLIRRTFESGIKTSLHCAIGTVGDDGTPHVTPIGHIFLRDDYTAYYFEEYTRKLRHNLEHNPRVCLLTVNSSSRFWLSSLVRGKFSVPPGIRLIGVAGERRLASEAERAAYHARVKPFRSLRGYKLLWRDLNYVREIKLQSAEPVLYPRMMDHLWS